MSSLRIAVASKDGISINQHFGHAREFLIFDVSAGAVSFVEKRDVALYCHGHHGDQTAMKDILQTISDCRAVMVAKVGDGPAEKLAAIGVTPVDDYAYLGISESLNACYLSLTEQEAI